MNAFVSSLFASADELELVLRGAGLLVGARLELGEPLAGAAAERPGDGEAGGERGEGDQELVSHGGGLRGGCVGSGGA